MRLSNCVETAGGDVGTTSLATFEASLDVCVATKEQVESLKKERECKAFKLKTITTICSYLLFFFTINVKRSGRKT